MKEKKKEILNYIKSVGGFDNFRKWTEKEIATWVYHNFICTKYTAKQVAKQIR